MADLSQVQSLDGSLRWIDSLEKAPRVHAIGAWPVGAVLEHLARSIEMSIANHQEEILVA